MEAGAAILTGNKLLTLYWEQAPFFHWGSPGVGLELLATILPALRRCFLSLRGKPSLSEALERLPSFLQESLRLGSRPHRLGHHSPHLLAFMCACYPRSK